MKILTIALLCLIPVLTLAVEDGIKVNTDLDVLNDNYKYSRKIETTESEKITMFGDSSVGAVMDVPTNGWAPLVVPSDIATNGWGQLVMKNTNANWYVHIGVSNASPGGTISPVIAWATLYGGWGFPWSANLTNQYYVTGWQRSTNDAEEITPQLEWKLHEQ